MVMGRMMAMVVLGPYLMLMKMLLLLIMVIEENSPEIKGTSEEDEGDDHHNNDALIAGDDDKNNDHNDNFQLFPPLDCLLLDLCILLVLHMELYEVGKLVFTLF